MTHISAPSARFLRQSSTTPVRAAIASVDVPTGQPVLSVRTLS